jgi:PKD repeat protein
MRREPENSLGGDQLKSDFSKSPWHKCHGLFLSRTLRTLLILLPVLIVLIVLPIEPASSLPGDIDASGRVDGYDLISFGLSNGSVSGQTHWNPDADLNRDQIVDSQDLELLRGFFGRLGISMAIWITDSSGSGTRILKLSRSGKTVFRCGDFSSPRRMAGNLADGTMWVADPGSDKVAQLSPSLGNTLKTFRGVDAYDLALEQADQIEPSEDSFIWVADYSGNCVHRISMAAPDNYNIDSDTGFHTTISGFNRPVAIEIDPSTSTIWVSDSLNGRIVRIDHAVTGNYSISTDKGFHTILGGFELPRDLWVNPADGNPWIIDYTAGKIKRVDRAGAAVLTSLTGFSTPEDITGNPVDGSIWIADTGNNRVVRLGSDGTVILKMENLSSPHGLGVDPLTAICWVSDRNNNRIVAISPSGETSEIISDITGPLALSVIPDIIPQTEAPTAIAQVSSLKAALNEILDFTGSGSDPSGTITLYEWDFNGDGLIDFSSDTSGNTTHAYLSPGIFTPQFRVTNDRFISTTVQMPIIRVGSLSISASAEPGSGEAPLAVAFSGSFIEPEDGRVSSFQWDFDGDGVFDHYSETSAATEHVYSMPGQYRAVLKITDTHAVAETSLNITVTKAIPVVDAAATPLSGRVPMTVAFSATASDADGVITLYSWDFDGNNQVDWFSTSSAATSHTYLQDGIFNARLMVTDNSGMTGEAFITVQAGVPKARLEVQPLTGTIPLSVTMNPSASSDTAGPLSEYSYDFEGDNVFDQTMTSSAPVQKIYTEPGIYRILLKVTDSHGLTDITGVTIEAIPQWKPLVTISPDSAQGFSPLDITFTPTVTDDGIIQKWSWNFGQEFLWAADSQTDVVTRLKPNGSDSLLRIENLVNPRSAVARLTDGTVWITDDEGVKCYSSDGMEMLIHVKGFQRPGAIDLDRDNGSVWIADINADRVYRLSGTIADGYDITLNRGSHTFISGINDPESVKIDYSDHGAWISDYYNNRVLKVDQECNLITEIKGFRQPKCAVTGSPDSSIWVCDIGNGRIINLSSAIASGYDISSDTGSHKVIQGLNYPIWLDVNRENGSVWVADYNSYRVFRFDSDTPDGYNPSIDSGHHIQVNNLVHPNSITVNSSTGNAIAGDYDSVRVFSADGSQIAWFPGFSNISMVNYSAASQNFLTSVNGNTATHTYTFPGTFTVALTATDDQGNQGTGSCNLTIRSTPKVTITLSVTTGQAPLEVFMDASIEDPDSRVKRLEWDFQGDGIVDQVSESSSITRHTFTDAGIYQITLKVHDTDNNIGTGLATLTVTPSLPIISFKAIPASGNIPFTSDFTISARDPDGTVTKAEIDFQGNGIFDQTQTPTQPSILPGEAASFSFSTTFESVGNYQSVVRITDNDNQTSTATVTVTALPSGLPVPFMEISPSSGKVPFDAFIYASAFDPDGSISRYELDFQGDGIMDIDSSQPLILLGDNVEGGNTLWSGDPSWTIVTSEARSGYHCWKESPGSTYDNNMNTSLTSPPLDLSSTTAPHLRFSHRHDFAANDMGRVEISTDSGSTWTVLKSISGSSNGWKSEFLHLGSQGSATAALIRFRFTSDSDGTSYGWFLDDLWIGEPIKWTCVSTGNFNTVLRVTDSSANISTARENILGLSSENDSFIWATAKTSGQILKLEETGRIIARISGLSGPRGIATDPATGDAWVADTGKDRVLKVSFNTPDGFSESVRFLTPSSTSGLNPSGMDGLAMGNATIEAGMLNNCCRFDGSGDYIQIPSDKIFNLRSFTLETWFRTALPAASASIFMIGNNSGHDMIMVNIYSSTQIRAVLDNTTSAFTGTVPLNDDQWHHLALTYDRDTSTLNCYVDSLQYGSSITITKDLEFGDSFALIGADFDGYNTGLGNYFNGRIDEVRIWNRPLSASEIAASMNMEISSQATGLIGHWPLNTAVIPDFIHPFTFFNDPNDIAVNPIDHSVWITDNYNGKIVNLSMDGVVLANVSGLSYPREILISSTDGAIWVTESGANRVTRFDHNVPDGYKISTDTGFHRSYPGFNQPIFMDISESSGKLWIADQINDRIISLNTAAPSGYNTTFNTGFHDTLEGVDNPLGIAVSALDQTIWVSDQYNDRVLKLTPAPAIIETVKGFDNPAGIAIDSSDGTVWICNSNANQIVRLAVDGTELLRVGGISGPYGITIDRAIRNQNQPPVAQAAANPVLGSAPLTVTLTGSATDDNGIAAYMWDFDGNGITDFNSDSTGSATYTFNEPGTYNPVFTAVDTSGQSAFASPGSIYVIPLKVFPNVTPEYGTAPVTMSFDGTVRGILPGMKILSYSWDFDGNGSFDWISPLTPVTTHRYLRGGVFDAMLSVNTTAGRAMAMVRIDIQKVPPTVSGSVTPLSGNSPLNVTLQGYFGDVDGSIVLFEWDYDGDGIFDWFSNSEIKTNYTYRVPGIYPCTVRVTDEDGLTASATSTITVTQPPPATPVAHAWAAPLKGRIPLTVNFNGSATDPDETGALQYEWDFQGDGIIDYTSTSPAIAHTFTQSGVYGALLTVTDSDGQTDTSRVIVTALSMSHPIAIASASPPEGEDPLVTILNSTGSNDPQNSIEKFSWTFGDNSDGDIWAVDYTRNRIMKMDSTGMTLSTISGLNKADSLIHDYDSMNFWVSDTFHNRLLRINALSGATHEIGGFSAPRGMAVTRDPSTSQSVLWVCNPGQNNIIRITGHTSESIYTYINPFVSHIKSSGETARSPVFGNPAFQAGKFANGALFNGTTDYVLIPSDPSIDVQSFTISAWIRTTTVTGSPSIFMRGNGSGGNELNFYISAAATLGLYIDGYLMTFPGTIGLADGNWHHVAAVHDATLDKAFTYVDGLQCGPEKSLTRSMDFQNSHALIGADFDSFNGTLGNFFKGEVDEVQLWSVARSAEEISDGMNQPLSGNQQGLAGYWPLDSLIPRSTDFTLLPGFNDPIAARADRSTGSLWVLEKSGNQLSRLDHSGSVNTAISGFNLPEALDIDPEDGTIWVADTGNNRIVRIEATVADGYNLSTDTVFHTVFTSMTAPLSLSVDSINHTVWAADSGRGRFIRISRDGLRLILEKTGFTRPSFVFANPRDGTVWGCDANGDRVYRFAHDGAILKTLTNLDNPGQLIQLHKSESDLPGSDQNGISHGYVQPGLYKAFLKVLDTEGNSDVDTISIKAGAFLQALPWAYPCMGTAPLNVSFASNASSPNSTIEYYYWDFDGNGTWDVDTRISRTFQHTYTYPGVYRPALKVVDNRGFSSTQYLNITVDDSTAIPIARALAVPANGHPPLSVMLSGGGLDRDGRITGFRWDFQGDGIFDYSSSTTPEVTHVYSTAALFTPVLEVIDNDGNTATASVRVEVTPPTSPQVTLSASSREGVAALNVTLEAHAADDSGIALYEWDFQGDGIIDLTGESASRVEFSYNVAGLHHPRVKVTDDQGLTATASMDIDVAISVTSSLSIHQFDPSQSEFTEISFTITSPAAASVIIHNRQGTEIVRLLSGVSLEAGFHSVIWNGKGPGGSTLPQGVYLYTIETVSGGRLAKHDLFSQADPEPYFPETVYPANFNPYNAETNFFRYTLPVKSEVTVYMSPFTGAALDRVRTLQLRQPQKTGSYVLVWDGRNDKGVAVLPGTYRVKVTAIDSGGNRSLPANALMIIIF